MQNWAGATQANLKKQTGAGKKLVILIDSNGTSYSGQVVSLGPSYIELLNGQNILQVWYSSRPFRFITLDLPAGTKFGVKPVELPLA